MTVTIRAAQPADALFLSELVSQLGYPATVEDVLKAGAAKARLEAGKTMELVRAATGLK